MKLSFNTHGSGEMASWYVLSALGIFTLEGAKDELVLGSPTVKNATVQLPDNKVLTVVAENQAETHVYVKSVTWTPANGVAHAVMNNVMELTELMQGGRLTFYMDSSPNTAAKKVVPASNLWFFNRAVMIFISAAVSVFVFVGIKYKVQLESIGHSVLREGKAIMSKAQEKGQTILSKARERLRSNSELEEQSQ